MATPTIVLVGKRSKKAQEALKEDGYVLIDVTSSSEDVTFRKFSPFYPHGGIPVPGTYLRSQSVEGVWQALKVFEKEGVDMKKLSITSMKNIKRAVGEKRGRVLGHQFGDQVIGYVEARKAIYVPTYQFVLENKLRSEIELLRGLLTEGHKIALVDYDVNEDIEDVRKPLSHASLIKREILV